MPIKGTIGFKKFHFPEIRLPNNDTLKFEVSMSTGILSNNHTYQNVQLEELSPINYPGEIDSDGQEWAMADVSLKFSDPDNEIETEMVLEEKRDTFLKILKNNQKKFDGYLDYGEIKKSDFEMIDGVPKYQSITLRFYDILSYLGQFSASQFDIDLSATNPSKSLCEHLIDIGNGLDLSSSINDTFWHSEDNGHKYAVNSGSSTEIEDLYRVNSVASSSNALEVLKKHSLAFFSVPYTQDGTFYFLDRVSRKTASLNTDDILSVEFVSSPKIDKIAVQKRIYLTEDSPFTPNGYIRTIKSTIPTDAQSNVSSSINEDQSEYLVDISGDSDFDMGRELEKIGRYYVSASGNVTLGENIPNAVATNSIMLTGSNYTDTSSQTYIEQGCWVLFNKDSVARTRMIATTTDDDTFYFFPAHSSSNNGPVTQSEVPLLENFEIRRESNVHNQDRHRWYKTPWIMQRSAEKADQYFNTFDSDLKIKIRGFWPLSASFDLDGKNYEAKSAKYELIENETDLVCRPVGGATGSFGLHGWLWETSSSFNTGSL